MTTPEFAYVERFVEEEGERWRIFESDEGIIEIQYQVFDTTKKVWWADPQYERQISFPYHIAKRVAEQLALYVQEVQNGG